VRNRNSFLLLPFLLSVPVLAGPINYVTNGGFETGATSGVLSPSVPGDLIYVFGVGGATNIGGWTVSASSNNNGSGTPLSVLVTGNPPQIPAGGSYAVDFDPFWSVSTGALLGPTVTGTLPEISQSFSLPAGSYLLSFDGALEEDGGSGTRPLTATLSGAATLNQTVNTSQTDDVGYTLFSFGFVSTGGSVTLTFTPNDYSAEPNFMLDNVSVVSAAPEPSFAPLVLGLLGLMVVAGRRRRLGV
jgi:MYXO-CTERM domain-containing protein